MQVLTKAQVCQCVCTCVLRQEIWWRSWSQGEFLQRDAENARQWERQEEREADREEVRVPKTEGRRECVHSWHYPVSRGLRKASVRTTRVGGVSQTETQAWTLDTHTHTHGPRLDTGRTPASDRTKTRNFTSAKHRRCDIVAVSNRNWSRADLFSGGNRKSYTDVLEKWQICC